MGRRHSKRGLPPFFLLAKHPHTHTHDLDSFLPSLSTELTWQVLFLVGGLRTKLSSNVTSRHVWCVSCGASVSGDKQTNQPFSVWYGGMEWPQPNVSQKIVIHQTKQTRKKDDPISADDRSSLTLVNSLFVGPLFVSSRKKTMRRRRMWSIDLDLSNRANSTLSVSHVDNLFFSFFLARKEVSTIDDKEEEQPD